MKTKEIRDMSKDDREKALEEVRKELMHERGIKAMGGAPRSPGSIRNLRRRIARILTIQHEQNEASDGPRR